MVGSESSASEVRGQEFKASKPLSKVRGHHFRPIFSRPRPHVKVLRDLEIMSNLRQLSLISPSNDASYSLHIIAPSGTKKKHPSCMVGCCLFYETMTKFRRQLAAHHVKPSTPRKSMTFGKLSPDKSRMFVLSSQHTHVVFSGQHLVRVLVLPTWLLSDTSAYA